MGSKSLCLTYFLWLIGGPFGLHHFYLRRYKQAFLWFCFPGGFFGLGMLRDLWKIPEYVNEANQHPEYVEIQKVMKKHRARPPMSMSRIVGQFIVGNLFGVLIHLAIPDEEEIGFDLHYLKMLLIPMFTTFGIWLVGNVGNEKGSWRAPLLGCYILLPFGPILLQTLGGVLLFQLMSRQWRPKEKTPSRLKSTILLLFMAFIYLSLIFSFLYFNLTVVTNNGDRIKFRHAVKNFLKSPAVEEFSDNFNKLFQHMHGHGFWSTAQELIDSLDPLGEQNALKVLELTKEATQADIKFKFRELSKIWHPDKLTDPNEKENGHLKFLAIKEAYEKLSSIKRERSRKNKMYHSEDEL
eukprot:TRINITY_DN4649_c0_g1_i1.p1 TRINITY_DN4649_c0_g1~~TRINITY_DN4649_c0_g1_i1.p1  ORF type:complete len:369 (-),score=67.29 TRINITY_DN4649_c0_g1_i1:243-1298(-)